MFLWEGCDLNLGLTRRLEQWLFLLSFKRGLVYHKRLLGVRLGASWGVPGKPVGRCGHLSWVVPG